MAAISQTIFSNISNMLLKCIPQSQIENMPSLVQIMAWRGVGSPKQLSEPVLEYCYFKPQEQTSVKS